MKARAIACIGSWLGWVGLLLGPSACADDPGVGSDSNAASSGGSSTTANDPTTSGLGVTDVGTSADTTAGAASSGSTTVPLDGTSSSGGDTSSGGTSSGGTTNEVTVTDTATSTTTGDGPSCGNGLIDLGEQCDGADVQGFDCFSLGLGAGVLGCEPGLCTFDTSGCGPMGGVCGDGVVDPGEQCDGANLQGFDCASLGLGGGVLACDPIICVFDTSMCMPGGGTSG
jgi:hypothetical protein